MKYSIGHLCYFVTDIDRSVDFYCSNLGFTKMFEQHFDAYDIHCVYLRICKNQFIELFSTKKPLDNTNASFQHLCLHVDDVAQAHAELTAKGLALTPVEEGHSKCIKCYLDDPDGNKIELMQLTAESLQTIYDHD